jgi:AcrR family transcriptional regulator
VKSTPPSVEDTRLEPKYSDTATRILDAAERLFVEFGLEATSLRQITQQAAVNLAAVNYHFRSKDALFDAVFERRFAPWARECLQELDALEARSAAGQGTIDVESVVMCYVRPAFALSKDPSRGGALFVRLFSRVLVENHRQLRERLSRDWGHLVARYSAALGRALPRLSSEEVAWRLHLGFSVMFHAFAGNDILKLFGRSAVSARDPDLIVKHVVPFVVAGMSATADGKPSAA